MVKGVHSGWDSFLLRNGDEVFLDEVSSVLSILAYCKIGGSQSEEFCIYMCLYLCNRYYI